MSIFRFKRFEVRNEKSAMKVNTDGVLLGAACPISTSFRKVLDIGTGTGTVALMIAQRLENASCGIDIDQDINLKITGIDIDKDAAEEAAENFAASYWANILEARQQSLEEFRDEAESYDLIVSNPPYYDSSLTNPDAKKTIARHTDETGLSFREVLDFAGYHLTENGEVSIILPANQEKALMRYATMNGLRLTNILRIKTIERKAYSRIIASFCKKHISHESLNTYADSTQQHDIERSLTIMKNGKYTDEYISLVKDFYLFA